MQTLILVTDDPSSQLWQDAHTQIRQYMASVLATKPDFQEVQILRATGGQIVFSTNPKSEGQYRDQEKYFQSGIYKTFVQNLYISSITNKLNLTISTPINGDNADMIK